MLADDARDRGAVELPFHRKVGRSWLAGTDRRFGFIERLVIGVVELISGDAPRAIGQEHERHPLRHRLKSLGLDVVFERHVVALGRPGRRIDGATGGELARRDF